MPHARDVRGLSRYILMGQIVSILMGLAGLVAIGLFFDPAIVGIAAKKTGGVPRPVTLFDGRYWLRLFCALFCRDFHALVMTSDMDLAQYNASVNECVN
jgi:hypothetical protein